MWMSVVGEGSTHCNVSQENYFDTEMCSLDLEDSDLRTKFTKQVLGEANNKH